MTDRGRKRKPTPFRLVNIDAVSDEAVAAKFKEVFGIEGLNQHQMKLARYLLKRAQSRDAVARAKLIEKFMEDVDRFVKSLKRHEN